MLDPERRELTRGSQRIAVGPQVFDLLLYLLLNRARVVSKDDLLDAVWKGRIVSESTLTSHINAVRRVIGDSGEDQRLVRTVARKGFRFVGEVEEQGPPPVPGGPPAVGEPGSLKGSPHALPLPDRPSIAVLPFLNLSGDPGQEYFTDGVVEDVITALSRVRWLFVIARNSSFTYKGRAVDVREVGRDLGARYVLEGSVRKAHDRIRLTGQLIDASSGLHVWAEQVEDTLDNIFELQDRLAESVVGAVAPQLERAEIERSSRKPTDSLDAYDYYLRGMASVHRGTRRAIDEALPAFRTAIEFDPDYASAYAMAAWCYFWRKVNGWSADREQEIVEGARLARAAVELGKGDAVALARGGHALAHLIGDIDSGIALIDRALLLNPNLAAAWFLGAFLRVWRGEPDDAIERFSHAVRLSPLDPEMYRMQAGIAMAHLLAGRADEASIWAERARRELPSFLMAVAVSAAAHAIAGRSGEAQRAMSRLRALDPALHMASLGDWLPFHRPADLATFSDGLRKAGLPE
ncbi:winged helix-turn-helix domain-containing tetratricopeptide repeat protein [Methylobacterium oryzisoli]|uniref:winged helix-turn-helix domain-containing tetratricopeptide repeat protein n=1 Tax=Methylobacterium oryzisoli TaxID=3385502 RepID=UPI0039795032